MLSNEQVTLLADEQARLAKLTWETFLAALKPYDLAWLYGRPALVEDLRSAMREGNVLLLSVLWCWVKVQLDEPSVQAVEALMGT